jgi:hypothetical protein
LFRCLSCLVYLGEHIVEIRLFGTLRRFAENPVIRAESMARLVLHREDTIEGVLSRIGVDFRSEVGIVFVNGIYRDRAGQLKVRDGDRLGVFPKDMALLYV